MEDRINNIYNRMFTKYYSGNELQGWHRLNYFGGGNAENYKNIIRKLLDEGKKVKSGYTTSKMVRGSKTHYIFYK